MADRKTTGEALDTTHAPPYLLVRVGGQLCALLLAHVEETLRPLPVRALAGAPPFVSGVTVLRGEPTPVIDARTLLGEADSAASGPVTRFVSLKAGRRIALAVDAVQGVARLDGTSVAALPSILTAAGASAVSALAMHDAELLLVLQSGRLVPPEVWDTLDAGGVR